jgi:hypothetical protein
LGTRCQDVVFNVDYDSQIRLAMRKSISEDDFADDTLKVAFDEIIQTLDQERNGKPKADDEDEKKRKRLEEEGPVSYANAETVYSNLVKSISEDADIGCQPEEMEKFKKWLKYASTAMFLAYSGRMAFMCSA